MEEQDPDADGGDPDADETLPGPPPDPSLIPSVVRSVGDLDLEAKAIQHGITKPSDPDFGALREFLEEIEEPEPLSNNLSGDPMAESWLQILFTLIVREHGLSSMTLGAIEFLLSEKMNREGIDLELFLDRLWMMGRLEKVYGGTEPSYSPNPSWLEMK
ncbi:MAG: hypothetical protein QF911_02375 [Candidatus Thalassarchaeaceae archaeon]|jgi:hypothetical protein|nr:hypothetical protein [Candidatus Thalassarchaeaceae archaeon]